MAAGVAFIAVGVAILFGIMPFIAQFEHSQFTKFDQNVIDSQTFAYYAFVGFGASLILLTASLSTLAINKIKLPE